MKSLGPCQNTSPRPAGQKPSLRSMGAFAVTAAGFAMLIPALNCAPGTLDCDEVGDQPGASDICSGKGNNGGNGGGGGGADCDPEKVKAATMEGCADHETVGDFEKNFLQGRCGDGVNGAAESSCHHGKIYPPSIKEGEAIFLKLADVATKLVCIEETNDKLINLDSPLDSIFYLKVTGEKLECPGGDPDLSGDRMPYSTDEEPEAELNEDEKNCVKSYVEAVAANCKL